MGRHDTYYFARVLNLARAWKLSTKDIDEDLREWNPHKLASGALVVIKSNLEDHRQVITGTVATRERS